LVIFSEENHENIRSLDAAVFTGILRKLLLVILSEENHENIRALEAGRVHWHIKKAYIDNPF
jgi:hypothetical protein